jgi:hypothetical protein
MEEEVRQQALLHEKQERTRYMTTDLIYHVNSRNGDEEVMID